MRIFSNLMEATREIERDIAEMGIISHSTTMQNKDATSDDFITKELLAYSFSLPIFDVNDQEQLLKSKVIQAMNYLGKDAEICLRYCFSEHMDRILDAGNPGNSFQELPEVWNEFLGDNGRFDYTYSERFHMWNQLAYVVQELQKNPETRRAILSVYDLALDTVHRDKGMRIPCSMYYQFLIRTMDNGRQELWVIYNMRSCDFYLHWIHDVIMAMLLANHIGRILGITPGRFVQSINSFHAYKRDYSTRDIF